DVLMNLLRHPDFAAGTVDTAFVERHAAELAARGQHPQRHRRGDTVAPAAAPAAAMPAPPPGTVPISSPLLGRIVAIEVAEGDAVRAGQQVAVIEAMKMEHVVEASAGGIVDRIVASAGTTLPAGSPLIYLIPGDIAEGIVAEAAETDPDRIRPDLAELRARL